jgi:hypothetical protein
MNMTELKTMFPRVDPRSSQPSGRLNRAATGVIPMDYFVAHEAEIRAAAVEYFDCPIRVMFRGPRPYKDATMTRRADAKGVLLYMR